MRLYLPGPQPVSTRERVRRALDFALRCGVTAIAGAGVACIVIGVAGAVTVLGDVVAAVVSP
jgi:hypothetical protein